MTEPKRKGRPATGRQDYRRVLLESGGRILLYRIAAEPNAALSALESCGEFKSATAAIDAALLETAKRRKL